MDIISELENMISVATAVDDTDNDQTIAKLQSVFDYSRSEAQDILGRLQTGLDPIVPLALWETVNLQQTAAGHDRLTYSHWLSQSTKRRTQQRSNAQSQDRREYLVQLGGPITADKIVHLTGIHGTPTLLTANSTHTGAGTQFCRIDGNAKANLLARLAQDAPGFSPLIVTSSCAKKEFSRDSIAPSVGIDSTLPQHRCNSDIEPQPAQNQYPVWYFFYGTLCDPNVLETLLGHLKKRDNAPFEYVPAQIKGAKMGTWGAGKYNALVDGPDEATVDGLSFLVESKEHEDALCYYETGSYEVARCKIKTTAHGTLNGCTFRFIGSVD